LFYLANQLLLFFYLANHASEPEQIDVFPFALCNEVSFEDERVLDSSNSDKTLSDSSNSDKTLSVKSDGRLGRRIRRTGNTSNEKVSANQHLDKNEDFEVITDNLVTTHFTISDEFDNFKLAALFKVQLMVNDDNYNIKAQIKSNM
jgi:hypothetical protein